MTITYPRYFMQPLDKIVYISNGVDHITMSLLDFLQIEPNYKLPNDAIGVQWIDFGDRIDFGFWYDGSDAISNDLTGITWNYGSTYVGNVAIYQNFIAQKAINAANPFNLVTNISTAQQIGATLINNHYDQNMMTQILANTALDTRLASGNAVYFLTLIEAMLYNANNATATPLIDAQVLPSENKALVISRIISQKTRFVPLAHSIKLRKSALLGLVNPAFATISDVINYVNTQIGTAYGLPGGS